MRKLLFFALVFTCCYSFGQQHKIRFEYDDAGNQILRKWCSNCPLRNTNSLLKENAKLDDSDMQKFYPEDVISYYPNPVKEELFLKWDLVNNNKVLNIVVFNLNGQVLKTINDDFSNNSLSISFLDYPVGVYFLNLNYADGDQKSIKIIKN